MNSKTFQSGQVILLMIMFLTIISLIVVAQASIPAGADITLARNLYESKNSSIISESGLEDISFRIRKAWNYDLIEVLRINGYMATTSVSTNVDTGAKLVTATSSVRDLLRSKKVILAKNDQISFNYGVQAGNGGFSMANSSSVVGNIYSNASTTGSGNLVQGSIVSAGPNGYVDNLHATSSVFAHTIKNSTIDKNAYYFSTSTLIDTIVSGIKYSGSPDKAASSFPISDAQIAEWEDIAENGGVISSPCPYEIKTSVTLGPKKIDCNLVISNNGSLTIAGMIWVNGNITIKNNSGIKLDSILGALSVALIADKTDDRINSSLVDIQNSTTFTDSGTKGSFIFLISANKSAEDKGSIIAIDLKNSAEGAVVLYSNHGKISIGNSSKLRSVTGYQINMKNSAQLIYEDGLESSTFDTGPGGSWIVDNWKEAE
ncbi:MAG TPA: hypothetical protein VJI73_02670 [Candidatus Paceibacterota bacterium]